MRIKVWNNYDRQIFKVTPHIQKFFKKYIKNNLSKEELKQIKEAAKLLKEMIGVEFEHNLNPGWENKLLKGGEALTESGKKLNSKEQIQKALANDGEIQFTAHKNTCAFIKKLRKPAHLCWD